MPRRINVNMGMSAHAMREQELEEALRAMCNLISRLQRRAAEYLREGNADQFINDALDLLDGPGQRTVQSRARALLSEEHVQITLHRLTAN